MSNVLTYVSILGTMGSLVFAAGMHSPLILIATAAFASVGFTLAAVTAVLGRKHLVRMENLPITKDQRFISGVISGFILASTAAFLVTAPVAVPLAIIASAGLITGAIMGMYVLPRRIANDKVIDYRTVLAGLSLGAALSIGLTFAFGLGAITASSAIFIGKYAFILGGIAA
ncbi:MAG: hypothetical protein KKA75_05160, partial [Proteobacteria bacterium]|nr:hypothetical protein [Pseudomonadota bacterium]